ncbi:hypothetical protein [Rhodanobacter ginsenosidimutans]|uniref:Restriction endonuclease n=1 Tax=Rhodanobacter ginsenosidimutans TaxID=490571 RepID=A0ABW0JU17_9GAMM
MNKTESEDIFEAFCRRHDLDWCRIPESAVKTPDYSVNFGSVAVAVEIKQIESLRGFNPGGVSSRTVGWHVRQQISDARAQLQAAARNGMPTILLIYNTVDPFQLFGTEPHDFLHAMYGELTLHIDATSLKARELFYGRNAKLREGVNTSFSGVGHLQKTKEGATVTVYKNAFAARPIPDVAVPSCIQLVNVKIENAA